MPKTEDKMNSNRRRSRLIIYLPLAGMVLLTIFSLTAVPGVTAANPASDPSVTLKYDYNATDVGSLPLLITYNQTGLTPPLSATWYVNGAATSSSQTFELQTGQAGNFTIYLKVSDQTGATATSQSVTFRVNPLPTSGKLQVPATTSSSSVTATLPVSGGTPPFVYVWTLNGKLYDSCSAKATCILNLTSGPNNISASATDFELNPTQPQSAVVTYQASSLGSSGLLLYAGVGGGALAAVVVVYFFFLRKRIAPGRAEVAVEAKHTPPKPPIQQDKGEPAKPAAPPPQAKPKPSPTPPPTQPIITIVKEIEKPRASAIEAKPKETEVVPVTAPPTTAKAQPAASPPPPPSPSPTPAQSVVKSEPKQAQAAAQPTPPVQPEPISISMLRKDLNQDPADWILDCIGGYDFWPAEKGPLPKSELEKEFKKKFPNITIANFNSLVYDLIYKDKVTSSTVNGTMVLGLTPSVKEEKAAEWNKRLAEARLLQAQLEARKQGLQPSERRKEWIELKPQTALGDGGPFDELNARMRDAGWYARLLTTGAKEVKSIMWHREQPVQESSPPKKYYPNIMLEWRQSGLGKGATWHIEGVNISEDDFRAKIEEKTWSEWLSKNKVVIDVPTWEEAVVKVLEMGGTYVK